MKNVFNVHPYCFNPYTPAKNLMLDLKFRSVGPNMFSQNCHCQYIYFSSNHFHEPQFAVKKKKQLKTHISMQLCAIGMYSK